MSLMLAYMSAVCNHTDKPPVSVYPDLRCLHTVQLDVRQLPLLSLESHTYRFIQLRCTINATECTSVIIITAVNYVASMASWQSVCAGNSIVPLRPANFCSSRGLLVWVCGQWLFFQIWLIHSGQWYHVCIFQSKLPLFCSTQRPRSTSHQNDAIRTKFHHYWFDPVEHIATDCVWAIADIQLCAFLKTAILQSLVNTTVATPLKTHIITNVLKTLSVIIQLSLIIQQSPSPSITISK